MTSNNQYKIQKAIAREVIDSRGNPTIEVELHTSKARACAIVPSGASTGSNEALELRDNDSKRYHGKGVLKAIENVCKIIFPALKGKDVRKIRNIDNLMFKLDGTENKTKLGANAILGVSLACCKLAAKAQGIPLYKQFYQFAYGKESNEFLLPVPMANVINGGKHAGGKLAPQEFMIMPVGLSNFNDSIRAISEIYQVLKEQLRKSYGPSAINVGDEGGFGSPVATSRAALDLLVSATEECGYKVTSEICFALDPAATEFHKESVYLIDDLILSEGELVDYWHDLIQTYPIISIEDPFAEESFEGFAELRKKVADKVQIVGDDLTVTNTQRLKQAIDHQSINSLLLKINQIGSITESIDAAKMCWANDLSVVVSHRSGETEDTSIADLSVGLCNGQIKTGSIARGERTAKYNRLLRIADELGSNARYASKDFRYGYKKYI
ncbi:MAG: phosphopyruvate hydratase [Asgard group archaeon]|nr:phosphopyruvate hydratase [Asgard group archaeon]